MTLIESHRKPVESVIRAIVTLAGKMQKRYLETAEFSGAVKRRGVAMLQIAEALKETKFHG